jgi:hypothetical protein
VAALSTKKRNKLALALKKIIKKHLENLRTKVNKYNDDKLRKMQKNINQ